MTSDSPTVRLAHFSDLHLTSGRYSWQQEDWFNKRLAAWMNLRLLGRGHRFRHAEAVLEAMVADLQGRRPDCLLFSGDASAMGFDEEAELAARLLRVSEWPGIAVPGNHDYCTKTAQRERVFERHFADWQVGHRVDPDTYPFARKVNGYWLVALCSATANRWPWDARGGVGREQRARLERLLDSLDDGPRVLVTHYPVVRASGWPEPTVRHLRDLRDVLAVCRRCRVSLWLHGHVHGAYRFPAGRIAPFPIICAGSATQTGLWSYGDYTLSGRRLTAEVRVYDPAKGSFQPGDTFELELP